MLDHLEANEESCDEANQKEKQRRRLQLESLQRPPRPKEHIFDGAGGSAIGRGVKVMRRKLLQVDGNQIGGRATKSPTVLKE